MPEISEYEKIHSYVTWPDRDREVFPNGNVTIGALGFPYANACGVANDGTCYCEDKENYCPAPTTIETEFSTYHGDGTVPQNVAFTATTNVGISDDGGLHLVIPVKALSVVGISPSDHRHKHISVTVFDSVSAFPSSCTLVKSPCTDDPLENVQIINGTVLNGHAQPPESNPYLLTADIDVDNDIVLSDLSESCSDASLFAVAVPISSGQYVSLTNQEDSSKNGIYQEVNGTFAYIMAVPPDGQEIPPEQYEEVMSDPTLLDNVGTCCGDHFRKTYSDSEVHDYVYDRVGNVTKFGVLSSVAGCQGQFVNWFMSTGIVDIGNQHGYPVFVNGFGLGSIVGKNLMSAPTVDIVQADDKSDGLETRHPWLLWSYGTTKNERTETNVSALPRDWPFTYDGTAYARRDDTSNVTLVKHGVTLRDYSGSETFGNLYADIKDEHGDVIAHRFYNRHHFVINQKYVRDEINGGYELKPFFIHLPAPIDTEDGETYEITVSIQNQETNQNPVFTRDKDIASYYAAMSQPRVFVLGGRQQFSNKKLPIKDNELIKGTNIYTVNTTKPAVDSYGERLPVGTEVRANIIAMLNGDALPPITGYGVIKATGDAGTTIEFNGDPPTDRRYYNESSSMYICGMAYLRDADDNPSYTRMGLVRDDKMLRGDYGSGVEGALDEINNFYSIDKKEDHRNFPYDDRRYLLATVYQTATNTFPWSMTNRRKLQRLDRYGSDVSARLESELDDTQNLIFKIYNANLGLISDDEFAEYVKTQQSISGVDTECYNIGPEYSPVSYGVGADEDNWINLASVLQVSLPYSVDPSNGVSTEPVVKPYGNPVRQAQLAIKNFTTDLYNMRLVRYTGEAKSEVKPVRYSIALDRDEWVVPGDPLLMTTMYTDEEDAGGNNTIRRNVMWSTLRSLPQYVYGAERYNKFNELYAPDSSVLFKHSNGSLGYAETTPYNKFNPEYASTDATGETYCGLLGNTNTGRIFSENSVIKSFASRHGNVPLSSMQTLNEMRRYADVKLKIELPTTVFSLSHPDDRMEWLSPFTDIMYKDGAPRIHRMGDLELTGKQTQFAAFDAVQTYRYMMDDAAADPVYFVSSRMPHVDDKSKALAKFIEKYVVACGADMPVHFYRGRRVELERGVVPSADDEIYINNFYRIDKRWNASSCINVDTKVQLYTYYLNDNFVGIASGTPSRDPNPDYAYIDQPGEYNPYAFAATMAPYRQKDLDDERVLRSGNTYTRVRMQFTFSQRAGRWYTTEYRQYPCNYLTPLYGNDALAQKVRSIYDDDGKLAVDPVAPYTTECYRKVWHNSACMGFDDYRKVMMSPYSSYPPMDITLGCVPYLYKEWPFDDTGKLKPVYDRDYDVKDPNKPRMWLLETPWIKYNDITDTNRSGISLYPPLDVNGDMPHIEVAEGEDPPYNPDMHANFWSVREFVRPATSILKGSDVPKYEDPDKYDTEHPVDYRKNGLESDPTLYRMFDFPKAGTTEYHLPNPSDPSEDMTHNYLLYHGLQGERNKEGVFQSHDNNFWFGYGVADSDQNIDD